MFANGKAIAITRLLFGIVLVATLCKWSFIDGQQ